MKDFAEDVLNEIRNRASSPLAGSFAISWAIWNYKFIVLLLSKTPATQTFFLIKSICFPDWTSVLLFGFIYPLITSAFYIFLYPVPAKFAYEYSFKRQREINEARKRIEEESPLTMQESRVIRRAMTQLVQDHFRELEIKDSEIARLKDELMRSDSRKSSNTPSTTGIESELSQLTESQKNLLVRIAQTKPVYSDKEGKELSGRERLSHDHDLNELVGRSMVQFGETDNYMGYLLTQKGRKIALQLMDI